MALYIYDDAISRGFAPLSFTRPAGELRVGVELFRRRWEHAFGMRTSATIAAPQFRHFHELDTPPTLGAGLIPAGSIIANTRCAVALTTIPTSVTAWSCDGRIAAVRLADATPADAFLDGAVSLDSLVPASQTRAVIQGRWYDEVWELIANLSVQLSEDIPLLAKRLTLGAPTGAIVLGEHPVYVEAGAIIEPQVCFDSHEGPILVRRGATVRAFTRVGGPCYIGEDSLVMGERVAASSIGEVCRAHGEMSNTIMLGHSNKGHDGFIGHSYLGRWVNLGAGTITSNLKNTYGTVSLWTPAGTRDTGLQFLGTLFGDHAKTGIGTRLTTGTVLGAGCNVYGSEMPPKYVAPFSWGAGEPYAHYRLDKFLEVAERVMARRHVELGDRGRRLLTDLYAMQERQPA